MNEKLKKVLLLLLALVLVVLSQTGLLNGLMGESKTIPETEPAQVIEAATQEVPANASTESTKSEKEILGILEGKTIPVVEDGKYTKRNQVAAYIHEYGHLPSNFITKDEAENLGWVNKDGNLWDVAPGKSIGGDRFGNYEGILPKGKGKKYFECDIDFDGRFRNAKRIVYSTDGYIYYTDDHYETFTLLYGGK